MGKICLNLPYCIFVADLEMSPKSNVNRAKRQWELKKERNIDWQIAEKAERVSGKMQAKIFVAIRIFQTILHVMLKEAN